MQGRALNEVGEKAFFMKKAGNGGNAPKHEEHFVLRAQKNLAWVQFTGIQANGTLQERPAI